ncbi:hypothetical protein LXM25_05905 [Dyadobacter sp. LJ53]|uniref:hypothetical protein n=1 Tax=Dyadobacter chenwenxiniae TaxID=2906456 RepID=UPI001F2FAF26|nr:hypothetical protein [Dyadobacter chenwenxiniae]MCF0049578.1 hypothetical protein [Dyadobacter chenwenxiniae]
MQLVVEVEREKTLADIGVTLEGCITCDDGSCSANVIHKQTGNEYNVYIRKQRNYFINQLVFIADCRVNSNSDSGLDIYQEFNEESELVNFLCHNFSGFKCF